MSQSIAFVFPGQGSQSLGMLAELSQVFPQVVATFSEASAIVQRDLWQIAQQGPQEQLNQTEITQPLMLAADIAVYRCWQARTQVQPSVLAGHSLGEYAALVVAGVLSFADAVRLVAKRGEYMQAAVPAGAGAMAAIVGLSDQDLNQICEQVAQADVVAPANFNSIGQTVIAGEAAAVDRAIEAAKLAGAKIAMRIPVSVPSHCSLMQPAAEKLSEDLQGITLSVPKRVVLHNVNASACNQVSLIPALLVDQLVSPVRWVEIIQYMVTEYGINTIIECGAGKVLAGLIKRINRNLTVFSIGLSESHLQEAINFL